MSRMSKGLLFAKSYLLLTRIGAACWARAVCLRFLRTPTAPLPCCAANGFSRIWLGRPRHLHHLTFRILTRPRLACLLQCANNWNSTARMQSALPVIRGWTHWDSGWKTSTPSAPGEQRTGSLGLMRQVYCRTEDHSTVHRDSNQF